MPHLKLEEPEMKPKDRLLIFFLSSHLLQILRLNHAIKLKLDKQQQCFIHLISHIVRNVYFILFNNKEFISSNASMFILQW